MPKEPGPLISSTAVRSIKPADQQGNFPGDPDVSLSFEVDKRCRRGGVLTYSTTYTQTRNRWRIDEYSADGGLFASQSFDGERYWTREPSVEGESRVIAADERPLTPGRPYALIFQPSLRDVTTSGFDPGEESSILGRRVKLYSKTSPGRISADCAKDAASGEEVQKIETYSLDEQLEVPLRFTLSLENGFVLEDYVATSLKLRPGSNLSDYQLN